jgi:hypothetical protein
MVCVFKNVLLFGSYIFLGNLIKHPPPCHPRWADTPPTSIGKLGGIPSFTMVQGAMLRHLLHDPGGGDNRHATRGAATPTKSARRCRVARLKARGLTTLQGSCASHVLGTRMVRVTDQRARWRSALAELGGGRRFTTSRNLRGTPCKRVQGTDEASSKERGTVRSNPSVLKQGAAA